MTSSKSSKTNYKIDLVYLWVDGSDPEFIKQREHYQTICNVATTEANCGHNYVNYDELRYSLRSVLKNAPWLNKIYIVTNGQIPKWLDLTKTDKIKIITHEQIMPKDALPTFHSDAIEACVCNIPGLEEHYILANDDTFINRPTTPDFFFDKNGKPIERLKKLHYTEERLKESVYVRKIVYTNELVNKRFNKKFCIAAHHNMDAYRKSAVLECKKEFKEEFDKIVHSKFRIDGIQRLAFSLYSVVNYKDKIKFIKNMSQTPFHIDSISMRIGTLEKMIKAINEHTPVLLCLNDHMEVSDEHLENVTSFLQFLYPEKQVYESFEDSERIYPEIIEKCQQINANYGLRWKIIRVFKYIISPIFMTQTTKKHKIIRILGIKIKTKKHKRRK